MSDERAQWRGEIDARVSDNEEDISSLEKSHKELAQDTEGRLTSLEKWRARAEGGAAVLAFLTGGSALTLLFNLWGIF